MALVKKIIELLLVIAICLPVQSVLMVGLYIWNGCSVPVRVSVVSSVPSADKFGICDLTIRSIVDGAESTTQAACPAAYIVGNTSVTYEACHPNGKPSDLHFLEPAFGIRAPRSLGIAIVIVWTAALSLFGFLPDSWRDQAASWCRRKSYKQAPSRSTGQKGACSKDVPPPSALGVAVAVDIPFNGHANKIDTVD